MHKCYTIVIVILWALGCQVAHSQEVENKTWSIQAHLGGQISNYFWAAYEENSTYFTLPEYKGRAGFRLGIGLQSQIGNSFYIDSDINYVLTKTALETGGVVIYQNSMGMYTAVQCDFLEKQTQQFLVSTGLGYHLFSFLSLEASIFGVTDLSLEQSKICKVTKYENTYGQSKNSGFGVNPSLVFTMQKWSLQASYGVELFSNRTTRFTDANGQDVGKFANKMQFVSLSLGYKII